MKNFKFKDNIAHMAVLLAGAVVMVGGCFQNSLWFDESYSVGLMDHTLFGVFKWGAFDVHPHLYYVLLKLFTMVFGRTLPAMRIFSAIGGILFAALGITHIRKDFGEKVGFWFSFCAVFSASTLVYALQIRMYTWAAYFVTLAAIYAYRSFKNADSRKNRVLFLVFSIASAYTHYFGLFAVAVLNIILLCYTVAEKRPMKCWWINAAIQIGSYIPGAIVFLVQISLKGASWIRVAWPDLVFNMVSYHLFGDVLDEFFEYTSVNYNIAGGIFLALYVAGGVLLWLYAKSDRIEETQRKILKPVLWGYFGTILFTLVISLFRPIYYIRYTVVICGLLFFMIALLIAGFKNKWAKAVAALVLISLFSVQTVNTYKLMYDPSANAVNEALDDAVLEGDQFLFEGASDYVITTRYPENEVYFYNIWGWGVQKTYRAFGKNDYVVDTLECPEIDSLGSRVWVIGKGECYNHLLQKGYTQTEDYNISMIYHDQNYTVVLMEKE